MSEDPSSLTCLASTTQGLEKEENECKNYSEVMSQVEDEERRINWTENDLKEAIRRINAGEINFKEAENVYGISLRTIHRQRAIENMRAQLNPEKAKKMKPKTNSAPKKDVSILRKPVEISCSTLSDVANLLKTGTEEVKQLLSRECDLIYECKICKNLFRSLANFISHKRIYCCDLYSVIHTRADENDDECGVDEESVKEKENIKEFAAKPFRVTCRKDLTSVLKRITNMSDLLPAEPILHLQTLENTPCAFQQVLFTNETLEQAKFPSSTKNDKKDVEKMVLLSNDIENKQPALSDATNDKLLNPEKHFVAEKRFRCPVCLSNFTIKRSVLRHLKSVHHKSIEQVEKLKSRIQIHFVRIRTNSSDTKEKQDEKHLPNNKCNSDKNWEKVCLVCSRKFTNKTIYSNHLKSCRRISSRSELNHKPVALVPVVSLTPITTDLCVNKSESEDSASEPTPPKKSNSSNSKKVSLPVASSSSSSQSKKIGIQVRMNYCKDNVSAPNSANGTPLYPSNDNSRRNSVVSVKEDEVPRISHSTRSGSKLSNILETLCDKRNREQDLVKNQKRFEKNDITVYCNSCRKVYFLNEFNCDVTRENVKRSYKCALRNCDFQAHRNSELLPHLAAKHGEISESEIANVRSMFSAEFVDENGFTSLGDCKRRPVLVEKPMDTKSKRKSGSETNCSSNDSPPDAAVSSQSCNKRKLPCNSKKTIILRRKLGGDVKIKSEENPSEIISRFEPMQVESIKKEVVDDSSCCLEEQAIKAMKKVGNENVGDQNEVLVNGIIISLSSSDEENEKTEIPKVKFNHTRSSRRQNIPSIDQKLWKTPQKMSLNNFHDMSPSSSTPESDLDQSMRTDEIMTIILGKGMSAEKVEENVSNREKSPTSSSSSDCGKEKRYSFRIAKQCTQMKTAPVENKDDKILKTACLNKAKPSTR